MTAHLRKECNRCHESFPLTEEYFFHDSTRADGWQPHCKLCDKKRITKKRKTDSAKKAKIRSLARQMAGNSPLAQTVTAVFNAMPDDSQLSMMAVLDEQISKWLRMRPDELQYNLSLMVEKDKGVSLYGILDVKGWPKLWEKWRGLYPPELESEIKEMLTPQLVFRAALAFVFGQKIWAKLDEEIELKIYNWNILRAESDEIFAMWKWLGPGAGMTYNEMKKKPETARRKMKSAGNAHILEKFRKG